MKFAVINMLVLSLSFALQLTLVKSYSVLKTKKQLCVPPFCISSCQPRCPPYRQSSCPTQHQSCPVSCCHTSQSCGKKPQQCYCSITPPSCCSVPQPCCCPMSQPCCCPTSQTSCPRPRPQCPRPTLRTRKFALNFTKQSQNTYTIHRLMFF